MGAVGFLEISFDALAPGLPAWYHVGMCHPANNEETRRTYCSRCEEVAISPTDNMCLDCCDAIDAERDAKRAEEDWATGYEGDENPYWDQHAGG